MRKSNDLELAALMYRASVSARAVGANITYEQGYVDGALDERQKLRLWMAADKGRQTQLMAIIDNPALKPQEALAQIRELTCE